MQQQPYVIQQQPKFDETSVQTRCPTCQAYVSTKANYENGLLTYLLCISIAAFGCWCGCCLIPFCVPGCKDVVHECPNCNSVVGRFKRA